MVERFSGGRSGPAVTGGSGICGRDRLPRPSACSLSRIGVFLLAFAVLSAPARAETVRILAVGDSLVAGYGLAPEEGFVSQLQGWLVARGAEIEIVNAGVSGDTTAMGRARLEWSLGTEPDAVLLALGANDMLRGIDPAETRSNLGAMLGLLRERNIPVLLAGMRAGSNLGPDYGIAFDRIYPDLAGQYGALLYPFLLEEVALDPARNQPDGLHPNAAGARIMAAAIGPRVLELAVRARGG